MSRSYVPRAHWQLDGRSQSQFCQSVNRDVTLFHRKQSHGQDGDST